ncbi:hypothetical protein IC229_22240 [Spirosoma sp. BT702]|uniref:Uncharacterized protein n=1 Tax=Spirosoma profusum TaxID=2771354 RepID=A0A927ATF4_9BACT|nr:hypothetical protein [Spirosoma profusum]MBD2703380.1 hypothetical protein [Spirosoma profusum]
MKRAIMLMSGLGDFLMSLSDRNRLLMVVGALGLLGGGSVYKLAVSLRKLQEPLPVATPEQLIDPMRQLFRQTSTKAIQYEQARSRELQRLDSLAKKYSTIKP